MKKTQKPITKEEAVSILASALSYCQQSGLPVMAQPNEGGALMLTLPGITVSVSDGRAVFSLCGDGTPAASDGTSGLSDGTPGKSDGTPQAGSDGTPQAVTA
ncbi:MAG TPA: hypothetical protein PKM21_03040 [Anaerolineales bacterium]|nr:hypothetical protein [Anaerolineales bacterium]